MENRPAWHGTYVVPVGVRYQNVTFEWELLGRKQFLAETVCPRPHVQNQERFLRSDFNARGVTAEADGCRAGLGDRTAGTPEPDPHSNIVVRLEG